MQQRVLKVFWLDYTHVFSLNCSHDPMDFLILAMVIVIGLNFFRARDQRQRIALLARHLGNYQIEKSMQSLTEGYLRALGEKEPARREQVWNLQATTEAQLVDQFRRFAAEFSRLDETQTRASLLPLALPFADKMFPKVTFDVRKAFAIHAQGIADASANLMERSPRDKAFTMSAELFLMQHTCHRFCRSKTVASARIMARHKTPYQQVLDGVSPDTRRLYRTLTGV